MRSSFQPFRIYAWWAVAATTASQAIVVPRAAILRRVMITGFNDQAAVSGCVQLNRNAAGIELAAAPDYNSNTAFVTSYIGNAYGQGGREFHPDIPFAAQSIFYVWWYASAGTTSAGVHMVFYPVSK